MAFVSPAKRGGVIPWISKEIQFQDQDFLTGGGGNNTGVGGGVHPKGFIQVMVADLPAGGEAGATDEAFIHLVD